MLRLHTFGTTYIARENGENVGGAATHRRTLALLALLASAGSSGLNRDKLIRILWPDSDEVRARHSLTQALYAARRALDADDLFLLSGPDIRINPVRLSSDVQEFDELIARGDRTGALALYRGPFLDAVFLGDAGDFERWSAGERQRIEQHVTDALTSLAGDADRRGAIADAVRWRRELAGMLPLDARIALEYMRTLAASGDPAGALRHAQVHTTLLRQELDLDAHPDVNALAERIRADAAAAPSIGTASTTARPATPAQEGERDASVSPVTPPVRGPMTPARPRWRGHTALAAGVLVLVALAGVAWQRLRNPNGVERASTPHVVVAPFRVSGADRSLWYLRDGVVELLSARLADDSGSRSLDAGAALRAARAAGLAATDEIGHAAATALARTLGVERVVVGSVVGTGARMVVSATMLQAADGRVAAEATVTGPADSLVSLIDRLTARLLVSEAGQEATLAHYTTRSLPALKSFLSAQAAYRRDDFETALALYGRAIRADSSFALAALYAATTADALHLTAAFRDAVAVAWSARDDLTGRDRILLDALAGPRYPSPSLGPELGAAWQRLVDAGAQSGDAWYFIGSRLLEDGAASGLPDARVRAIAALQRAEAARDAHARASVLLRTIAADSGRAGSRIMIKQYAALPSWELRAIALAGQYGIRPLDESRRALEVLRARADNSSDRIDVALAEHSLGVIDGSAADVAAAGQRLRGVPGGSDAWLRLRVLDAVHGDADSALAAAAMRTLSQWDLQAPLARPVTSAGALANACVVAQWKLAHGDSSGVARTIDLLRQAHSLRPPAASAEPSACAALLDVWLAVNTGADDAALRLAQLDSLAFTPQVAGDAATYAHLVVARLFLAIGDSASARRAVRESPYFSGWPRYARVTANLDSALADRDEGPAAEAR